MVAKTYAAEMPVLEMGKKSSCLNFILVFGLKFNVLQGYHHALSALAVPLIYPLNRTPAISNGISYTNLNVTIF